MCLLFIIFTLKNKFPRYPLNTMQLIATGKQVFTGHLKKMMMCMEH